MLLMDPFQIFVLLLAVVLIFLLRNYVKSDIIEQYRAEPYTDYKHCEPVMFSINGCGIRLYTVARQYSTPSATSYSAYQCISLFYIPIIPLKCYRAVDCDENKYIIYGPEQWLYAEVIYLYLTYYRWIVAVAAVAYIALSLLGNR